jgi:N-acetylneuraminic acid mutarotase
LGLLIVIEPMPSNRGGIAASNSSNDDIYVIVGEHPPGSMIQSDYFTIMRNMIQKQINGHQSLQC